MFELLIHLDIKSTNTECRVQLKRAEYASKPSGGLLILIAACIAVVIPLFSLHMEFRDFDLDPRLAWYGIPMNFVFWAIFAAPLHLLILFLIRRRNLGRILRSLIVLSPAILITTPTLLESILDPEDAEECFVQQMGLPLPADASGFKTWYSHSPGESNYMFCFNSSPASISNLIATVPGQLVEMPMMAGSETGELLELPIHGRVPPPGWPRPKAWDGLQVYKGDVPGGYRYILTDASKSRVFVIVGDT